MKIGHFHPLVSRRVTAMVEMHCGANTNQARKASAVARLERQAEPYARRARPVLPALELIASIANADPGEDGLYRSRQPDAVIARYLRAARRAQARTTRCTCFCS